jgi:uncharacterized protein YbjT (DUF2867 family)
VGGTRRLLEAARAAGVSHLVYISIVGVDEIPFGYYRRKLAAERLIESSGVPFSVHRLPSDAGRARAARDAAADRL